MTEPTTERPIEQREQGEQWMGGVIPLKYKPYYIIASDTIRVVFMFVMVYFMFFLGMEQKQWTIDTLRDSICPAYAQGLVVFGNGTITIKPGNTSGVVVPNYDFINKLNASSK